MKNFKRQIEMSVFAFLFSFFAVIAADAHGDNKPGPNGGQIRMPGPFHTEAVAGPKGFKVFLLDINFEKPMVQNSEVKASVRTKGKTIELKCKKNSDHFFCPVEDSPQSGKLILQTIRDSVRGSDTQYDLPLQ